MVKDIPDTCGWCAFMKDCKSDGHPADYSYEDDLCFCIPKDMFVGGQEPACSTFVDEEEGILDVASFTI